jgi:hypothetical protein
MTRRAYALPVLLTGDNHVNNGRVGVGARHALPLRTIPSPPSLHQISKKSQFKKEVQAHIKE